VSSDVGPLSIVKRKKYLMNSNHRVLLTSTTYSLRTTLVADEIQTLS